MANDLSALRDRLNAQLDDAGNETWTLAEKGDMIADAVRNLYPRTARPFSAPIYPLTADTENYAAPTGMREVYRIDVGEVATDLTLRVLDGAWYTYDDPLTGGLALFINKQYSDTDHYFIVHGYGTYDLGDNLIPDDLVPLVLAGARAEAYRRQIGKRARFEQWGNASHEHDVSVNELLAMTQEAVADHERQRMRLPRTARRPVPGRLAR